MARANFTQAPEEKEFALVPMGKYILEIDEITEKFDKNNNTLWSVVLKIKDPDCPDLVGEKVFDNWSFVGAGLNRLKIICKCLGLPYEGDVDFREEDFLGQLIVGTIKHENYTDRFGEKVKKASIPFKGYEAVVYAEEEVAEPATYIPELPAMPPQPPAKTLPRRQAAPVAPTAPVASVAPVAPTAPIANTPPVMPAKKKVVAPGAPATSGLRKKAVAQAPPPPPPPPPTEEEEYEEGEYEVEGIEQEPPF